MTGARKAFPLLIAGALVLSVGFLGCAGGGEVTPPVGVKGTVNGTVTGPDGKGIVGATVQLNSATVASVKTTEGGKYVIRNVPSGAFKVSATYYSQATGLLTGASSQFPIDAAHTAATVNLSLVGNSPPPPPF